MMNKDNIIQSCYRLGLGTPYFFPRCVVGVSFDNYGNPYLMVHTKGKVPKTLIDRCEGKYLRIVKVPITKGDEKDWVVLH